MSRRYPGLIRALWSALLGKLKPVPTATATHDVPPQFQNTVHALSPQVPTCIHNQETRLSCSINAGCAVSEWRPRTKNLDTALDPAHTRAGDPTHRSAQILSLLSPNAWRVAIVDHPPRPAQTPACRVRPWLVDGHFHTSTRTYPIPYEMGQDRRAARTKTSSATAGRARVRIRASSPLPRTTIRDGTALSRQWRVRRPSLNLYRMPIDVWHGYVDEIRRQKALASKDVELVGVFPIPHGDLRDVSVDLERDCIFYRFTGEPGASVKRAMMLVGRDKATGALYTVIDRRPRGDKPAGRAARPSIPAAPRRQE